jgi:hypothetical protein
LYNLKPAALTLSVPVWSLFNPSAWLLLFVMVTLFPAYEDVSVV